VIVTALEFAEHVVAVDRLALTIEQDAHLLGRGLVVASERCQPREVVAVVAKVGCDRLVEPGAQVATCRVVRRDSEVGRIVVEEDAEVADAVVSLAAADDCPIKCDVAGFA
jgi:hypothetical protein